MRPVFERTEKVWGHEELIVSTPLYTAKYLVIKPGFQSSLHLHHWKMESFVCVEGRAVLEVAGHFHAMNPGVTVHIAATQKHRFSSYTGATLLEVSTHHDDDDVLRFEESRAITK